MDEWIKKLYSYIDTHTHTHTHTHIYIHTHTYMHTYTMEGYSFIKIEILPFVTTWMDLEGIKVSEISQTEEDK